MVMSAIGYKGGFVRISDTTKRNGTPVNCLMFRGRMELAWSPRIALKNGIAATYAWFKEPAFDARL